LRNRKSGGKENEARRDGLSHNEQVYRDERSKLIVEEMI